MKSSPSSRGFLTRLCFTQFSRLNVVLLAAAIATLLGGVVLAEPMTTVSPSPSPVPQRLRNISARARVQTDQNVLIAGIIVRGNGPKDVLVRALGPSLAVNGTPVPGRLSDPTLELYVTGSSTPVAVNNNWRDTQENDIRATGLAPSNNLESAVVKRLNPGQYTAIVRGRNGGTGIGLLEAYDVNSQQTSKLANISTRGFAGTGGNVLIGGMIVGGGAPDATIRVVVRAIGPSLGAHGLTGALPNPSLQLVNANGMPIGFNDDWRSSQAAEIAESGLAPENDLEAALVALLPAGNYTAIVGGQGQTTGTALIEVYDATDVIPLPGNN